MSCFIIGVIGSAGCGSYAYRLKMKKLKALPVSLIFIGFRSLLIKYIDT